MPRLETGPKEGQAELGALCKDASAEDCLARSALAGKDCRKSSTHRYLDDPHDPDFSGPVAPKSDSRDLKPVESQESRE